MIHQTKIKMTAKLKYSVSTLVLWPFLLLNCDSPATEENLSLFSLAFEQAADLNYWEAEIEGGTSEWSIHDGTLDINASGGATIWFKEKLSAPVEIEYTALVVDEGALNDRVSDLNCFWMAKDPRCIENIFACEKTGRTGKFSDYHVLKTYYVGYGGHNNSKTRFRRYTGTGERPLLPNHDLGPPHRIVPNKDIKVCIKVFENRTTYAINDQILFDYQDETPYLEGWFAFRTVRNHLKIKDFKVKRLEE